MDNLNNLEREYQEQMQSQQHNYHYGKASRDWGGGDIDWSCYEDFRESVVTVINDSPSPHKELLFAALSEIADVVVTKIQSLDPRYKPTLNWGDTVIYRGKEYRLHKPIGHWVQLSKDDSIITVPWGAIERPE